MQLTLSPWHVTFKTDLLPLLPPPILMRVRKTQSFQKKIGESWALGPGEVPKSPRLAPTAHIKPSVWIRIWNY